MTRRTMTGAILTLAFACAGLLQAKEKEIYIDTAIKPGTKFEEAQIKSVAVLNFDAKDVQTIGGQVVNYFVLSKSFADDLIKKIYSLAKIDVALGQYEDFVIEKDTVDKKKGDLYINSTSLERSVKYNCVPFKKITAVLTGTVNKYRPIGDGKGKSFISVTLKLTDSFDGTVYWITDMEGYYKDVVHTIAYTLSTGKYEEPVEIVEQPNPSDEKKPVKKAKTPKTEPVPAPAPVPESTPQPAASTNK